MVVDSKDLGMASKTSREVCPVGGQWTTKDNEVRESGCAICGFPASTILNQLDHSLYEFA